MAENTGSTNQAYCACLEVAYLRQRSPERRMMNALMKRFRALRSRCTTYRGNKYLLAPDKLDSRWGIDHAGGCEPITRARAEKLISKMEAEQTLEGSD